MEDVLTNIITISSNSPEIQNAAQTAVDLLHIQDGLIRDPPYELRQKCFAVLGMCLETRRTKFTALAVSGIHKILKDDRFHSSAEPEDDSKWLPLQLLQATKSFLSLSDDTQVDILKILLNIACSKKWELNGRIIISIISLCSEAFDSGNSSVKAAAQAAASQTLRCFCLYLEDECESELEGSNFNDVIPLMQFICSKIEENDSSCENSLSFFLECLLTLFSSLSSNINLNHYIRSFLWQKLCPALISVLGTPKVDKVIVTRLNGNEKERGRGSGGLGTAPSFNSIHAKTVYNINTELVRLFGGVSALRPVLESVFHRVLLYPAPEHRLEALRAVMEVIRNPNRVLDLSAPLIEEKKTLPEYDMALLRLIMDSIKESSTSSFLVSQTTVRCCFEFLKAVEELSYGRCIPAATATLICELNPSLSTCDYIGPKTYQSMDRLPEVYRERIKNKSYKLRISNTDVLEKENSDICSSGDTEGPEEEENSCEDYASNAASGVSKLHTIIDSNITDIKISFGDKDRQRARDFVEALNEFLPLLTDMRSSIQVDQAIQSFASQYCEGFISELPITEWNIISADGIYLASYSALLLDMSQYQARNYELSEKKQFINEDEFVKKVQGNSVVAYLSCVWLREIYQIIVSSSLLQKHGYLPTNDNSQPHALINLLIDVEGIGSCRQGSQMLSECRRLVSSYALNENNIETEAGLRISRRILTCAWDTLLKVLAVPLTQQRFKLRHKKLQNLKFLVREERQKQIKQSITLSVESLQIIARLCNNLGLQKRSGSILDLLASTSCNDYNEKKKRFTRLQSTNGEIVRLTSSHSLSLDLVLGSGLELGSHCPDCWPHVFRCCVYVKKLEHKYFSKSENRILGSSTKVTRKEDNINTPKSYDLTFDPNLEEDTCIDVYSFLCSYEMPQTVSELVSTVKQTSTDILKQSDTAKVICVLSQLVDKLFEDAALKLNLKALESFAYSLCSSSYDQLFSSSSTNSKVSWWQNFIHNSVVSEDTLLLDSVGEVMIKCVRSGRPLFHVMKVWAIIGPHLTECACHKDLTVSRKAVKHIHDVVNRILVEHPELPYFYVNETLFKPFENLLSLELCEPDIQDQIVSCICEFVETSFKEIRSGWRTLFGALRVVSTNTNILLDIFKVFLETDNTLVFSNAAVDYITCLLKHLRARSSCNSNPNLGFETIKYLKRCETVLSSMYAMSDCLVFRSAHQIQVSDGLFVDSNIADFEDCSFETVPEDLKEPQIAYPAIQECTASLDSVDKPSGVLRVWFLLLEGLYSAAISANSDFQPFLLDLLYSGVEKLLDDPGPIFGLIIINRLILPVTQSWLRQLSNLQESNFMGLKQSIGLLSDLALHYFLFLQNEKSFESLLTLLLNQTFVLLSECSIHPIPAVAKMAPACMSHIFSKAGNLFSLDQWKCVTAALHRTCNLTLTFLRRLMTPFSVDSQHYYGDSGQVKVAVRKAVDLHEVSILLYLFQRVFLLDEQQENINVLECENLENQKLYTFIIQNEQDEGLRITMKSLVVALQVHQSVLQIIGDLLLRGTSYSIPSLSSVLLKSNSVDSSPSNKKVLGMPGLMNYIKPDEFNVILSCLDFSYRMATAFDSRPGLKFLIQKVAGLKQAANLYKQAKYAWVIKLVSLFEYCLFLVEMHKLGTQDIKIILENTQNDSYKTLHFLSNKLQKDFNNLCRTYVEVVINRNENSSLLQDKSEKQIFFLIASQEDQLTVDKYTPCEKDSPKDIEPHQSFFLSDFSKQSYEESTENLIENTINFSTEKETNEVPDLKDSISQDSNIKSEILKKALSEHQSKEDDSKQKSVIKEKEYDPNLMFEVLQEYKKKKKNYSEVGKYDKSSKENPVPTEIEEQQQYSFLKDGEALHQVYTEMLASAFDLLQKLDDGKFQKLLPVFMEGIHLLMAHVSEPSLKKAVSELFQRVGLVYGFGTI